MIKFFQKIVDYFMSCEKCDKQNTRHCPFSKFDFDPIMGEVRGYKTTSAPDFFCKNFERR